MAKIVPINATPNNTLSPDQIAQAMNQSPPIQHEIISYITKLQSEQDKYKTKINFSQTALDSSEKKPQSQYIGLNDNIHIDADKKSKARRSLLYLLNNLSGGSFCPEILEYFEELKKVKRNEQLNNVTALNESVRKTPKLNDSINLKNPLTRTKTLKDQLMNNNENVNPTFKYNFKKREEMKEIDKIEENEELFGMKSFKNDYNLKEYEILYSVDEIETGSKMFQYTKEAQAKKKLTKKKEKNKRKKNTIAEILNKSKEKKKTVVYNKANNSSVLNNINKDQIKPTIKPKKFFDVNAIEEADDSSHSSQKDNE